MSFPTPPRRIPSPPRPEPPVSPPPAAAPETAPRPTPVTTRRLGAPAPAAAPHREEPTRRGWWPFGRRRQAPPQRPGQPGVRPAGPVAIPATVTLTVSVTEPQGRRAVQDANVSVNRGQPAKTNDRGQVTFPNVTTNGRPIAVEVTAPGLMTARRMVSPNRSVFTETIVLGQRINAGWILGMAGMLVAVLGILVLPRLDLPTITMAPPSIGQLTPLDWASAPWLSPVHWLMAGVLIAHLLISFPEGSERKQIEDAIASTIAFLLVTFGHQFSAAVLKGGESPAAGGIIAAFSLFSVVLVSLLHGVDLSSVGTFFGLLGHGAVIRGSLGAIGVWLKIPDGTVYPLDQAMQLATLQQWDQLRVTQAAYAFYALSLVAYLIDMWKPWDKRHMFPWLSAAIGMALPFVFLWLVQATKGHPLYVALLVLLIAIIAVSAVRKYGSGAIAQSGEHWTRVGSALGFTFEAPWDGLLMNFTVIGCAVLTFGLRVFGT